MRGLLRRLTNSIILGTYLPNVEILDSRFGEGKAKITPSFLLQINEDMTELKELNTCKQLEALPKTQDCYVNCA